MKYRWRGLNQQGKIITQTESYATKAELIDYLQQQNIVILSIQQPILSRLNLSRKKFNPLLFFKTLANLLGHGFYLPDALALIIESEKNAAVCAIYQRILTGIKQGECFHDCLAHHTNLPSDLIALVKLGETTATIDTISITLHDILQRQQTTQSQIRKMLFYPACLLFSTAAITAGLLIFIVPQFQQTFANFGAKLPAITLWLLSLSDFFSNHLFALLVLSASIAVATSTLFRFLPQSILHLKKSISIIPSAKKIQQHAFLVHFTRTLAISLKVDLPLPKALTQIENTLAQSIFKADFSQVRPKILTGGSLSSALSSLSWVPTEIMQLIQIGEASGNLADILDNIAHRQQSLLSQKIEQLTKLLEPAAMILISVIVGVIVLAMYLPIFEIGNIM
jgi:type IV pilus assembly protein PilC